MQDTTVAERFTLGTMPSSEALESFVVSTPGGRARLLSRIQEGKDSFSPEQHTAYNALRDGIVKLARGEGTAKDLQVHARVLGVFLRTEEASEEVVDAKPFVAPVHEEVVVSTPSLEESAVKPKEEPTVSSVIEQVLKADTTSPVVDTTVVMAKGRRGPDVASPAETPVVTLEMKEEKKVESVPENRAPKEKEVVFDVMAGIEDPLVRVEALGGMVTQINDRLNAFAHGKAFQWLSNPEVGYKEYMNELIAIRALLSAPDITEADFISLNERITHLKEMADAVQKAVGGGSSTPEAKVADAKEEAPSAWSKTPAVVLEDVASAPSLAVAPGEKQNVEGVTPVVDDSSHVEMVAPEAPLSHETAQVAEEEKSVPLNVSEGEHNPAEVDIPVAEESVVAETSPLGEATEVPADTQMPEAEIVTETSQESSRLFSPEVTTGLNNLLTQWLGSTGFLGFGDSGLKHPDWLLMKDLRADDIHVEDGIIPKGLRPETFTNLGENIRAWSTKYGLFIQSPEETVEHFLRRVVDASIARA